MSRIFKGRSSESFEAATDNAIAQIPPSKAALRTMDNWVKYTITAMGKEIGGISGQADFFVEIEVP